MLDVGTGTGRAAIALARRGAIVTGVDASNEMLGGGASVARPKQHVAVTFAARRRARVSISRPQRSTPWSVCAC